MKTFFFHLFSLLLFPFFKYSLKKNKRVFIFDIDNTIADTWQSLLQKWDSEAARTLALPVFESLQKDILKLQENSDNQIIFLTARSPKVYPQTIEWLNDKKFNASYSNVFVVPNPTTKITWLSKVCKQYDIVFIDDLSFHHETGNVKFYQKEIDQLQQIRLTYIGYHELIKIQQNKMSLHDII
jgi:hypothetical protein